MWTRLDIKTKAKEVLKLSYWKAFLVSIILAIVTGGSQGGPINFRFNFDDIRVIRNIGNMGLPSFNFSTTFIIAFMVIFFTTMIIGLAIKILLLYPLIVGGRRYFKRASENEVNLGYLGYSFNGSRYLNIVKTMFYKGLLLFLWFLLLIIPGIIKSYAYAMVPYILADNPQIGYKRAIELSNKMTDGEKLNMFILDLSFIGWYLLGILALGVGVLFVHPYYNQTKAELYLVLRHNALNKGYCSPSELNMN